MKNKHRQNLGQCPNDEKNKGSCPNDQLQIEKWNEHIQNLERCPNDEKRVEQKNELI